MDDIYLVNFKLLSQSSSDDAVYLQSITPSINLLKWLAEGFD